MQTRSFFHDGWVMSALDLLLPGVSNLTWAVGQSCFGLRHSR